MTFPNVTLPSNHQEHTAMAHARNYNPVTDGFVVRNPSATLRLTPPFRAAYIAHLLRKAAGWAAAAWRASGAAGKAAWWATAADPAWRASGAAGKAAGNAAAWASEAAEQAAGAAGRAAEREVQAGEVEAAFLALEVGRA